MATPFLGFVADGSKSSIPDIRAMIDTCHESKQSGIIPMVCEGGKSLYLFLKRGDIINSCTASLLAWESVASDQWSAWIDSSGGAKARFFPLSTQGILISKLLIQNSSGKAESIAPSNIGGYLEAQKNAFTLSLLRFDRKTSSGAILFCGSPESSHSLYISSDDLQDQPGIAPVILNNPDWTVTEFKPDPSIEAWQEYLLRRVFADVCDGLLARFQALVGRTLVDSLIRLTQAFAARRNLNIDISSRKVVDNEFFSSSQLAADSYRSLLKEMLTHFSGITGTRLLSSTLREIVTGLPEQERTVIRNFSLLTEGYIYERHK